MWLDDYLIELIGEMVNIINKVLSMPSAIHPILSPDLMLIGISILFGWFYGRKAFTGIKTVSITLLSIMMYCTLKFIGCA